MCPADILAFVGRDNDFGKMFVKLPQNVQMKYLVTVRVYSALLFEPTPGLWKELMERAEGKVKDVVDLSNSDGTLRPKVSDDEYDRTIAALADAIRETVSGKGIEQDGALDADKQAAMDGVSNKGG